MNQGLFDQFTSTAKRELVKLSVCMMSDNVHRVFKLYINAYLSILCIFIYLFIYLFM